MKEAVDDDISITKVLKNIPINNIRKSIPSNEVKYLTDIYKFSNTVHGCIFKLTI